MSKHEQYLKKDVARRRRALIRNVVKECTAVVALGVILGQIIRIYVG